MSLSSMFPIVEAMGLDGVRGEKELLSVFSKARVNVYECTPPPNATNPRSRGAVIVEEGSLDYSLYFIRDGAVRVDKGGKSLATMGQGELFGEVSFLETGNMGASARCIATAEQTSVSVLSGEILEELLAINSLLAVRLYHLLAVVLASKLNARIAQISAAMGSKAEVVATEEVGDEGDGSDDDDG
jgi:CRP-like cAMP-binding protein